MIRRALAVAALSLLVATPPILAGVLRLDGGSLAVFTGTPELPIVTAAVEIRPATLVRDDRRSRVTVLIEAPDGAFDVRRIVSESIRLCLDGPLCDAGAAGGRLRVGDADHDGIRDLKVTFSRADVLALVAGIPAAADITFVVSAVLRSGKALSGTDSVRIVDSGPSADGDEPDGDQPGGDETAEAGPDDSLEPPGLPEGAAPSPTASPGGSAVQPAPSIVPPPMPAESGAPSCEPSPPGEQPTPTPQPSGEPTAAPMPTTAPTPEPTPGSTPAPLPSATPAPDPGAEPTPSPSPGEGVPSV